jgi:hypothetical protein
MTSYTALPRSNVRVHWFLWLALAAALAACGDAFRWECTRYEYEMADVWECVLPDLRSKYGGCLYSRIRPARTIKGCLEARCRDGYTHGGGTPRMQTYQLGPPRDCLTREEAEQRRRG